MVAKKYDYYIGYLNEDGQAEGYETVAESDGEAFERFEIETGCDESDITDCKRIAL